MRNILILLVFGLCFSCGAKKGVRYFEDIDQSRVIQNNNFSEIVYKTNDLIKIRVSSFDNVGVAPFNLTESSFIMADGVGENSESTRPYLVKPNGTIDMPILGEVNIAGRKREEIKAEIKTKLEPYLNNPRVELELINFSISVIGDVKSPGVFVIKNERITVLEAVALAGDLSITGKRRDITILREEDGKKKFIKVNFLDNSLFELSGYYLQQNDVVYVEQNSVKTRDAGWESKLPLYASIVALTLTFYSFFTR